MLVGACAFNPPSSGGPVDASTEAECADTDGDGVCNEADDWPCGAKPEDPGEGMRDESGDREWTAYLVVIGERRRVVKAAGEEFRTDFGWTVEVNCGGPSGCMAFLEYGFGATRSGCVRGSMIPSDRPTGAYTRDFDMRAPMTPGVHELRLNAARIDTCGDSDLWFGGDPGPESTIAFVCVPP